MERNAQQTMRTLLGAIVMFMAIVFVGRGNIPTPTPFDASKVDVSNITAAEIAATIAHRNALHQQLIDQTLPAASDDVKAAVDNAQNLQKQIDVLALNAAKVPALQDELSKAHSAIWRDVLLCLGGGFVLGLFGPKLLALASMIGI
jgi:NAD(P)-dependent dehydrogenase (short-subunit alcohol dehydrogenase family)